MKVDREALAWAAGFFDGEGNARYSVSGRCGAAVLTIGQVDRTSLFRFQAAMGGLGRISSPRLSGGRSPISSYALGGFERVQAAFALLYLWLGPVKRAQFVATLDKARGRLPQNKINVCKARLHDMTDPANVIMWGKTGRLCRTCYYEKHPIVGLSPFCPAGHDLLVPENVGWQGKEKRNRYCLICKRARSLAWWAKVRATRAAQASS